MDFRYLGNSGLKVSETSSGNWLTHASQLESEALGIIVERDPAKTEQNAPQTRPGS